MQNFSSNHKIFSLPSRHFWLGVIFIFLMTLVPKDLIQAATLSTSSLSLSDPRPSAINISYTFLTGGVTLAPIKCIKQVYSDTASGSTVPAGMSTAAANLDTANTNYIPSPASWTVTRPANGTLTLTNAIGETPTLSIARKVTLSGITNASSPDTRYFLRLSTYNNVDCTSSPVDSTSVTFILTNGSTLSMTVDATLSFTVNAVAAGQSCNGSTSTQPSSATTIPFGTVSPAANSVVCQDLQAATNATNGYTISTRSLAAPTNSIGQTLAIQSGTNSTPSAFPAPGTEAYGYTTDDASLSTLGGTAASNRFQTNLWAGMTTTNSEVGYESAGVTATTYRVGHQAGVSLITRPGTYQTTIIYTCTPVY